MKWGRVAWSAAYLIVITAVTVAASLTPTGVDILMGAYVVLSMWVPFHFWRHDHIRRVAYRNGRADGHREAATARLTAYGELVPRGSACGHGYVWGSPEHVCAELPSNARA